MASPTIPAASVRVLPRLDDTIQRLTFKILATLTAGLGLGGTDWVTDTAAHTGDWWIFHAVSDCVIAGITYQSGTSSGTPAGATIKAGDRIYGNIRSLTLISGAGELYRATI